MAVTAAWEDVPMLHVPAEDVDDTGTVVELDPVDEARAAVAPSGRGAGLLRGDALRLPLADESVDLVVTSPPYFALRSYRDGDEHYAGQLGSEESPQAFLEALWAVTAECARVLKPSGSMFVNLGDKYAGSGGHNNNGLGSSTLGHRKGGGGPHAERMREVEQRRRSEERATRRNAPDRYNQNSDGIPAKSLMLLPERYRIGCVDQLGLIARAVIVWDKPNGLPESVRDRVRRSHEDWVHLTKRPQYFAAVDEIREAYSPHTESFQRMKAGFRDEITDATQAAREGVVKGRATDPQGGLYRNGGAQLNPLGKLPGSVWTVATEPLRVPDWLGVDHFAAFPTEWPRRLILGWSPSGVCVACGEGRRPVVDRPARDRWPGEPVRHGVAGAAASGVKRMGDPLTTITGYACDCVEPNAPTKPAIVFDPFVGTGTVPMVARSLGRFGVGVDLSADYLRLARWRVWQSGHSSKAVGRTWRERQESLFGEVAG